MIRSAEGRLRSVFTFPRFHSLSFVNLRRDLPFAPSNQRRDLLRESYSIPKDKSTQSRRLVRRKGASWSLHWPSGANLLAHLQLKCILYVPL